MDREDILSSFRYKKFVNDMSSSAGAGVHNG